MHTRVSSEQGAARKSGRLKHGLAVRTGFVDFRQVAAADAVGLKLSPPASAQQGVAFRPAPETPDHSRQSEARWPSDGQPEAAAQGQETQVRVARVRTATNVLETSSLQFRIEAATASGKRCGAA